MLILPAECRQIIEAEARRGYPDEVCGFLVGEQRGANRHVRRVVPAHNIWDERPELRPAGSEQPEDAGPTSGDWEQHGVGRRFLVAPVELLAVIKQARQEGLEVIGLYHSHPDHPAEPSAYDLQLAWPEWSYVIVSTTATTTGDLRSWVLPAADEEFCEEAIALPDSE